jgi:hypothetical protein
MASFDKTAKFPVTTDEAAIRLSHRFASDFTSGRLIADEPKNLTGQGQPLIAVDGLTYAGMPEGSSVKAWTEELRNETRAYAAQPYQQLAAACRATGQDRQAREVLIAQRKHETKRGGLGPVVKAWAHITDWTIGYGWKPWKH